MTREELDEAKRGADCREDRIRLDDGYWALRICTTSDLRDISVREAEGRRKPLLAAIKALESLGHLEERAAELAADALAELRRRLGYYNTWIRDHQPRLAAPAPAPEPEEEEDGRLQQALGAGEEAAPAP